MKTNRPAQLSDDALQRYINFRYSLNGLLESDRAQLAEAFPKFSSRRWYRKALEQVYAAAYYSGRLTDKETVTGAEQAKQEDFTSIASMRDVAGGGAMDVGVAVLVRDLVDADTYRKVTAWWTKAESAWLPEPDPEPQPEQPNVPRTATLDPQSAAAAGPDYPGRPGGPHPDPDRAAPLGPAGRPRNVILPSPADILPPPRIMPQQRKEPVVDRNTRWTTVDRETIRLQIAQEKANRRSAQKRLVRSHSRQGTLMLVLALISMFVGAVDLGGAITPIGQWLGPGHGALFWLGVAVALIALSVLSFRRSESARKAPY